MGLEKINKTKKKLGITTEELSIRSGVSLGTLNKILSGVTKDPKLETIRSIAYTLGLTLDDLTDSDSTINSAILTKSESSLLSSFNRLNDTGQTEATKRVEELTHIDKYIKQSKITPLPKKEETPEHLELNAARPRKGATDEDRKHDDDIMDDENF